MDAKKNNPFGWPFAKQRQCWIADGDRLIAEAAELLDDPAIQPFLPNQRKRYAKAARLYIKSADFYRRGGLGLMAQASWQDAAECYAVLGEEDEVKRCELRADSIITYWDDEE